jgi:hypothetical protein
MSNSTADKTSGYDSLNDAITHLKQCVHDFKRYMPILNGITDVKWSSGRLVVKVQDPIRIVKKGDKLNQIGIAVTISHCGVATTDRMIWVDEVASGNVKMIAGYYSMSGERVEKLEITVNEADIGSELTGFIQRVLNINIEGAEEAVLRRLEEQHMLCLVDDLRVEWHPSNLSYKSQFEARLFHYEQWMF